MDTRIVQINRNKIDQTVISEAGQIILSGGLVAFPTETVYGLGANGLDANSSKKTYHAKGRPADNPLIIHIASMNDLPRIVKSIPSKAKKLAKEFWPGPLTMIFQKSDIVPYETTGGLESIAVRMPGDEIALALIKASGGFVSAPSANSSGRPSPTDAKHVYDDLHGRIHLILDGGKVEIGLESTIVDMTITPPMILRPGFISREQIEEVIGHVNVTSQVFQEDSVEAPKAPGMKYRHYAPRGQLTIVEGTLRDEVQAIRQIVYAHNRDGESCGVIASEETEAFYSHAVVKSLGSRDNDKMIARNLYRVLREFDDEDVKYIYSESFAVVGMGDTIMNRLNKAAGHTTIQASYILKLQKYRRIVFLGGSDVCRSPMAAEILRSKDLIQHFVIQSRGLVVLFPEPINPKTESIMKVNGFTLAEHTPKGIKKEDFHMDTLILCLDETIKKRALSQFFIASKYPVFTIQEFTGIDTIIPNPIGQKLTIYGECFEILDTFADVIVQKLNAISKPMNHITIGEN